MMDLALRRRSAVIRGDDADISRICRDALLSEGAELTVSGTATADIVVVVSPKFQPVELAALDARQLADGWQFISEMAAAYQHVLPHMKQQNWGRLIYVGSMAAKEFILDGEHLARTIGLGALGLQKTLSGELGPFNITCNNVLWDPTFLHGSGRDQALRAIGAAVTFLASEPAAYLTGTTFTVDRAQSRGVF